MKPNIQNFPQTYIIGTNLYLFILRKDNPLKIKIITASAAFPAGELPALSSVSIASLKQWKQKKKNKTKIHTPNKFILKILISK